MTPPERFDQEATGDEVQAYHGEHGTHEHRHRIRIRAAGQPLEEEHQREPAPEETERDETDISLVDQADRIGPAGPQEPLSSEELRPKPALDLGVYDHHDRL
jgi:hypothetical protein